MHSWKHSGFSAHTAVRVVPDETKTAERVLRYLLRPPVANSRTRTRDATQIEIRYTDTLHDTPQVLTLDPLDFLARATSHIPRPRQHQLRYYGAYAPRACGARRKRLAADSERAPNLPPRDDSPAACARRLTWAKLLRRVLEIEPLACPTCPGKLRIVSFITDHALVDHIIAHLRRTRPGLLPPARGSPTPTPTETSVCRADADGFITVTPILVPFSPSLPLRYPSPVPSRRRPLVRYIWHAF